MPALQTLCVSLVLTLLVASIGASSDDSVHHSDRGSKHSHDPQRERQSPCWPESEGQVQCLEDTDLNAEENERGLKQAVNFARQLLTNQSTLVHKEEVVEVIDFRKEDYNDGLLYFLKLRLNDSKCDRESPTCDPEFDPKYLPRHNETRILAELHPLLTPGKEIEINGFIPMTSKGFHITVQTGSKTPVEGQLRMNVKLSGGKSVIQLEYFDGGWNLYSRAEGHLEPLRDFQIHIVCLHRRFEIHINRVLFSWFNHILPYEDATHLAIIGGVTISRIRGVGTVLPPNASEPSHAWLDDDIQYQVPTYVPFVAPLAGRLAPGKSITIKGVIPMYSHRFAITLQNGPEFEPERAPLRLLADFPNDKEKQFALWHKDGSWIGPQMEAPVFTRGHAFQIIITCHSNYFQIRIDGEDFAKYFHEVPYADATHLSVTGMVNITKTVGVKELPQVTFLDKPMGASSNVHLEDVTLTPGRKLKIWAYISERTTQFQVALVCSDVSKCIPAMLYFSLSPTDPSFTWYTFDGEKEEEKLFPLPWLRPGQPLQIEIYILENSYQIVFFGMWSYNFGRTSSLNSTEWLSFYDFHKGSVIYAVDGVSSTPPPPPVLPPPSRVCSLITWYRPADSTAMWLTSSVTCTPRNTSLPIIHLGSADNLPMETSRRLHSKLRALKRSAGRRFRRSH